MTPLEAVAMRIGEKELTWLWVGREAGGIEKGGIVEGANQYGYDKWCQDIIRTAVAMAQS